MDQYHMRNSELKIFSVRDFYNIEKETVKNHQKIKLYSILSFKRFMFISCFLRRGCMWHGPSDRYKTG